MSTRIGIITDAHANLPATQSAIVALDDAGCDLIIHMGDAIGIGPHPREVLELLLHRDDIVLLMGNHDQLFAFDQLNQAPGWMSPGELEHQRWTQAQLPHEWRERISKWPLIHDLAISATTVRFQHYAINDGEFAPISRDNSPAELDALFQPISSIVFFGHHHPRADVQGISRYINPGALGTNPREGARYAVIEALPGGTFSVELQAVPYDSDLVTRAMIDRQVPEAEFILKTFLSS